MITSDLAINGGKPVRESMLPYGRHFLDDHDLDSVLEVLKSDWLTTGPKVREFEKALCFRTDAKYAVAVNSGTAALHSAMYALNITPGDEVIVPAMTFAATANCVLYQGGTPVFSDVRRETLLINTESMESLITSRTKAVISVDYAGQPCDYDVLRNICDKYGLILVADSCHSLGGTYKGRAVGSVADINAFSFHPVKHVAAGEGGAITTDNESIYNRIRAFRNHGIQTDHHQRSVEGAYKYDVSDLGFNYRIPDINCALALSQLEKLEKSVARRQAIAKIYDSAFHSMDCITPLNQVPDVDNAYHLYVIGLSKEFPKFDRDYLFKALRAENIGVNVHYLPVYLHPYYRKLGYDEGICPTAEDVYKNIISLPIFPSMDEKDIADVLEAVTKIVGSHNN